MKDLSDAYLPKMHCQDVLSAKTRIPALIFNYRNSGNKTMARGGKKCMY